MGLSVIIPAHNEEKLLPETLLFVRGAIQHCTSATELIVVDNESSDNTARIAFDAGARVIKEHIRNIGKVRNAGAAAATAGDILVFIDADTQVPETLLSKIEETMADEKCMGGAVKVRYGKFERWWMNYYSMGWEFWGRLFNMKQGAAQFCRSSVFNDWAATMKRSTWART